MRRLACWMPLVALSAGVAWGAAPKTAAAKTPQAATRVTAAVQASLQDLARNTTLGAALLERDGSPDELAAVQKLADRGLKTAQELVRKNPTSADARYLLGSWLLYGYRVVQTNRLTMDAQSGEHYEKVQVAQPGLAESPRDGLEALAEAHELAPGNLRYLLDYGSALLEWEQPDDALAAVRRVWATNLQLTPAERSQVALLMSDIHVSRSELAEARAWLYRSISEQPGNIPLVNRLRNLDALAAEAARAAAQPAPPAVAEEEGATEEEPAAESEEEAAPAAEGAAAEEEALSDEGAEVPSDADSETEAPGDEAAEEAAPADSDIPAAEVGD